MKVSRFFNIDFPSPPTLLQPPPSQHHPSLPQLPVHQPEKIYIQIDFFFKKKVMMFPFHIVRCAGKKTTISRVSTSLYVKSNCDRLFAAVELVFGVVHPGYSECLSWTGTYTKREKREQNFKYFSSTETSVLYTDFKHVSRRKSGFKGARTRRCILKSRLCLFRYTTQYNSFTFV